jgi:hypothetical protein
MYGSPLLRESACRHEFVNTQFSTRQTSRQYYVAIFVLIVFRLQTIHSRNNDMTRPN